MKLSFRTKLRTAQRYVFALLAASILAGVVVPVLNLSHTSADSLASREIKMSDSGASSNGIASGVGSGTNVTYRFQFTVTNTAHSLVVDFCQDSPIIADTSCVTPTGLDISSAALAQVGSGVIGGTGWSGVFAASQIKLHDDGSHGISTGDATSGIETFDITGITNPDTVGSFYARIYTYNSNIYDQDGVAANGDEYTNFSTLGTYKDFGGIAMSTTETITITARVQEALTFCVTASDPANWTTAGPNIHSCADAVVAANPPALTIGTGSPTKVLSATTVDFGAVYTQLSTNATHGAIVRIRNSNGVLAGACGGLSADGGASCDIPANNGGSATPSAIVNGASTGNAEFGLFASDGADDPGTGGGPTLNTVNSANCLATSKFHTATHASFDPNHSGDADTWYGMDTTTANDNVKSTFGAQMVACSSAVYRVDNYYQFAVTPSLSTPAGIYKANLSMIATGTF